jgi:hypothetical protein
VTTRAQVAGGVRLLGVASRHHTQEEKRVKGNKRSGDTVCEVVDF